MKEKLKTKPQLSRSERERRTVRILVIVILVAIVAVLGLIGYGYYASRIKPWHQPIVRVNDTVFDMNYFVKMLRLYGLDSTADASSVESVVTTIENNELIRQEAKRRGISLNATEVDNKLKELGGFNSANQTEKQFYTQLETNLASHYNVTLSDLKKMIIEPIILPDKLQAAMGNETNFQVQVQAMLLGTEEEASQVMTEWNAGGNFTQLAANTTYSISHIYDNSWLPRGIESSVFDGFAFNSTAMGKVSDPIRDTTYNTTGGYWIIEVLEQTVTDNETKWHIQGILLDSNGTAAEMRDAITGGSGNFTQLANDNSLDTTSKASGGDLGWLTSAEITSKFGADNLGTIQALEPDVLSEPIYSATVSKQSGYWLIKVISNTYNKWLEGARTGEGVKNYLDPEGKKIAWALAHL